MEDKSDKAADGHVGELTQQHPDMVLAIPFFTPAVPAVPTCIGYLPSIVCRNSRGFRSEPATFRNGVAKPRQDYARFIDEAGLTLLEVAFWASLASDKIV